MEDKLCSRCSINKPISEFYFSKSVGKYAYICKSCETVKRREYYRNVEKFTDYKIRKKKNKTRTTHNKERVRTYLRYDNKRGFNNNISLSYLTDSLKLDCIYCNYPSTGLDRINNDIGHIMDNCVPCCKECNIARMNNFTHEEMLIIGKAIKEVKDNRLKTT